MFIPEVLVIQDPAGNVAQGLGRELERVVSAAAGAADEPGAFEDADVFAEAGEGHWIWFGEIGYACGAASKAFEDGAARGIGDGVQDAVDVLGTLNHTVKLKRIVYIVNRIVQCIEALHGGSSSAADLATFLSSFRARRVANRNVR